MDPDPTRQVVDVLLAAGVFTQDSRPDACTVNAYEQGQWIPPHIDNTQFDRPFCTVGGPGFSKLLHH